MRVCVCACVCVRACMRACVRECVCVCVGGGGGMFLYLSMFDVMKVAVHSETKIGVDTSHILQLLHLHEQRKDLLHFIMS